MEHVAAEDTAETQKNRMRSSEMRTAPRNKNKKVEKSC